MMENSIGLGQELLDPFHSGAAACDIQQTYIPIFCDEYEVLCIPFVEAIKWVTDDAIQDSDIVITPWVERISFMVGQKVENGLIYEV